MLETEIVLVTKHYGTHYHRFTVNAQFVTLISGLPIKLSPRSGIVRLVKKVEKRTVLKGSILPWDNEFHVY